MRFLKYAAVLLAIVAIIATVVYLRRDSIARDIANSVLGETDVTVIDVSLDVLATDRVEFSKIVLELASGTRIDVRGVAFPLSFPSVRPEHVSIEKITVTPADAERPPTPYTPLLATILALPQTVPSTAVTVAELAYAELPTVTEIVWASGTDLQRLSLHVVSAGVAIEIGRIDAGKQRATLAASVAEVGDALTLELDITPNGDAFRIGGPMTILTSPWLPTLEELGNLPEGLKTLDAELAGPLEIALDDGEPGRVTAGATLSAAKATGASYRLDDGPTIEVEIPTSTPMAVAFQYPSLDWTAVVERSELLIDAFGIDGLPLEISQLACRAGIECDLDVRSDLDAIELPQVSAAAASLSASLTLTMHERTIVDLAPDASLTLTDLDGEGFSVRSLQATAVSGTRLTVEDDAWQLENTNTRLVLDRLSDSERLSLSMPVTLTDSRIRDSATSIRSKVTLTPGAGTTLRYGELRLRLPGIDGDLSLDNEKMRAKVELAGVGLSANGSLTYDLAGRAGNLALRDASLSFDRRKLSARAVDWPYDWDIVAGSVSGDLDLEWTGADDGIEFGGSMSQRAEGLAGRYEDVVFAGLDARIAGSFDSEPSLVLSPSRAELALLEAGVPLEALTADFSIDAGRTLTVDSLSMSALGGQITADPFLFNASAERNEIVFRLRSIQLQFMADIIGSESIDVNGSVSGMLPVSVQGKTITIASGRLENDPPGGVIRYSAGEALELAVPKSSLNVVTQALTNFEFDSLTSDVNYREGGDLILKMRLAGINPDVDPNQPVIINLSIENNIPQLLRSLQAIRSIEDILERETMN